MAAIITNGTFATSSGTAGAEQVRTAFIEFVFMSIMRFVSQDMIGFVASESDAIRDKRPI